MIEFTKTRRPLRELPLTSMIDVVFILIFFFMLTTSFMRIESMEMQLPEAARATPAKPQISRIILHNDGGMSFGNRRLDMPDLQATLTSIFHTNPKQSVVVFADDAVLMQQLVTVLDTVNIAGGQSVYVRPLHAGRSKRNISEGQP